METEKIQSKGEDKPSVKLLRDRVKELNDQIRGLELSGNPEDWKRATAQRLVVAGFLEAIMILKNAKEN